MAGKSGLRPSSRGQVSEIRRFTNKKKKQDREVRNRSMRALEPIEDETRHPKQKSKRVITKETRDGNTYNNFSFDVHTTAEKRQIGRRKTGVTGVDRRVRPTEVDTNQKNRRQHRNPRQGKRPNDRSADARNGQVDPYTKQYPRTRQHSSGSPRRFRQGKSRERSSSPIKNSRENRRRELSPEPNIQSRRQVQAASSTRERASRRRSPQKKASLTRDGASPTRAGCPFRSRKSDTKVHTMSDVPSSKRLATKTPEEGKSRNAKNDKNGVIYRGIRNRSSSRSRKAATKVCTTSDVPGSKRLETQVATDEPKPRNNTNENNGVTDRGNKNGSPSRKCKNATKVGTSSGVAGSKGLETQTAKEVKPTDDTIGKIGTTELESNCQAETKEEAKSSLQPTIAAKNISTGGSVDRGNRVSVSGQQGNEKEQNNRASEQRKNTKERQGARWFSNPFRSVWKRIRPRKRITKQKEKTKQEGGPTKQEEDRACHNELSTVESVAKEENSSMELKTRKSKLPIRCEARRKEVVPSVISHEMASGDTKPISIVPSDSDITDDTSAGEDTEQCFSAFQYFVADWSPANLLKYSSTTILTTSGGCIGASNRCLSTDQKYTGSAVNDVLDSAYPVVDPTEPVKISIQVEEDEVDDLDSDDIRESLHRSRSFLAHGGKFFCGNESAFARISEETIQIVNVIPHNAAAVDDVGSGFEMQLGKVDKCLVNPFAKSMPITTGEAKEESSHLVGALNGRESSTLMIPRQLADENMTLCGIKSHDGLTEQCSFPDSLEQVVIASAEKTKDLFSSQEGDRNANEIEEGMHTAKISKSNFCVGVSTSAQCAAASLNTNLDAALEAVVP